MNLRRFDIIRSLYKRSLMRPTERQILRNVLLNGLSYPGDVMASLGLSPTNGIKKINILKRKGYLLKYNGSSLLRINPDRRKDVKIMTSRKSSKVIND